MFDVFYKLVFLHNAGVKIHLHCFENSREQQAELHRYCFSVNYYHRQVGHKGFSDKLPYIVCSRNSPDLVSNLLKDEYPILLEGIHCSFLLNDDRFRNRKTVLRLHKIEHIHYRKLFRHAFSPFKKLYFLHESKLLKRYEAGICDKATLILSASESDSGIFKKEFKAKNIAHLPVFTGFNDVKSVEGIGCFCLYHGNLSNPENEKAAVFLLKEVFDDLNIPFVIAGKNPTDKLKRIARTSQNICLVENPDENEMADMIGKAQIHVLPSVKGAGIKLKLLNALFNGRHCIVDDAAVKGTGFEPACHVAGNAAGFKSIIAQLYHRPFTIDEINLRKRLLYNAVDNAKNANRLIQWIW
jgi:hypothetical protein